MNYREHRLASPLDAFVECVWFLKGAPGADGAPRAPVQRILPDGCAELIFHFRDRFHAVSNDGLERQPASFLVGVLTAPLIVAPANDVDTMGVRFRPGGASPFVREPLSALTDRACGLDALWGHEAAPLWDRLVSASDDRMRLELLSQVLRRRAATTAHDAATSAVIGALVRSAGRTRIAPLAARAGMTTRRLQRRFAERVGVSPKLLARILRFQRTLLARGDRGSDAADWVRIAVECGYADQSHLIRDYAAFAGETPRSLLAAEGELSAYFTARPRLTTMFGLPSCIPRSPEKR